MMGIPYLTGMTEGIFLLSGADLWIHEVGHLLFGPLGRFIAAAGGTILQLAVPILSTFSFYVTRQRLSLLFGVFWLGENLLNVSRYVSDARSMALPLVNFGGEVGPEGHDWHYLLGTVGLLRADHVLGAIIWVAGGALIIASITAAIIPADRWRSGWQWLAPRLDSLLFDPTNNTKRPR